METTQPDIEETKLRPVPDAFEDVTGRRPSLPTCGRYSTEGRFGILLRRQRVGGRWYSSRAWVREFVRATHEAAEDRARLKRSDSNS